MGGRKLPLLSGTRLGLISLISSSQAMTTLTRERATASQAIRAYVERMRSLSLTTYMTVDQSTPIDFLPSATSLKNPEAMVQKCGYEDGTQCSQIGWVGVGP